ncbi:Cell division inhibitor MinD [Thalassovita autumnalis]|uniref:Cell division inhibitor MinD n=1 Tax=Thalassovita autumnalis TaxID=2072972 RepID=A0A0P1FJA4_9RHOB|nr:AAA family ATPase [Thalassovita autumnalis]CUH68061.1 Cell division inhibitor MinD [Thalassovita autumnalis]CUH73329.1 Cell division inhibitor MinD [Thalassovita autumnalis]
MTSNEHSSAEVPPILACTISRDVQNFDLLIEDMEDIMGEAWGDLGFTDALAYFQQPDAAQLEFVALAVDHEDEQNLPALGEVIAAAKERLIKVILITDEVTPGALHQLLRQGADEFVPYPLPDGELKAAIDRVRTPEPKVLETAAHEEPAAAAPAAATPEPEPAARKSNHHREGVVIAVQGLAGGTGATTLAVNLGWELVNAAKKKETPPRVCLLDLDLQFGSVSTFLDLPRREVVYELLSDTEAMDDDIFSQALSGFEEKLYVLTAPVDILPLDLVEPEDIERVIAMARKHYDYVIVDLPKTLVQWSETVLHAAHVYFATLELDMRSAQNTLRLKRALQSEGLPFDKLRFVLNRAPKFTDLNGKSRVKRLADSLDIKIDIQLPDGGKQITQSGDHGTPLAQSAAKNPLRKEIAKLAASLHKLSGADDK